MRSIKVLVLVCLQLSLRGTDAAPTTTTTSATTTTKAPTTTTTKAPRKGKAFDSNQYSWEWNEMDDDFKGGDELEVEYEQPTQPAYRPTPPPTYRRTPPPTYRPTPPPTFRPTPPPYGAVPNPTVEFKYEDVGSDYP